MENNYNIYSKGQNKRIGLTMTEELNKDARAHAKALGIPFLHYIRGAMVDKLKTWKK